MGRLKLSGHLAWLTWMFVHIFFLIGFQNRLLIMLQWLWSYFTHERGARLITRPWPARAVGQPIPAEARSREQKPERAEVASGS